MNGRIVLYLMRFVQVIKWRFLQKRCETHEIGLTAFKLFANTSGKAKVLHWFKMQDYDKNKQDGHEILDKELKALGNKLSG